MAHLTGAVSDLYIRVLPGDALWSCAVRLALAVRHAGSLSLER